METIREHWISLDKCPQCKSKKTFHSEWMKNEDIQRVSSVNAFRIWFAPTIDTQGQTTKEAVFSKEDLCLKCGHVWTMFVQHLKYTEDEN